MKKDNNRFEIKPSKMNIKNLDNKEEVTYNDSLNSALEQQKALDENVKKAIKKLKDEEE